MGGSISALTIPGITEELKGFIYLLMPASGGALISLTIYLFRMLHSMKDKEEVLGAIKSGNDAILRELQPLGSIKTTIESVENTQKDMLGVLKDMLGVLKDMNTKLDKP